MDGANDILKLSIVLDSQDLKHIYSYYDWYHINVYF